MFFVVRADRGRSEPFALFLCYDFRVSNSLPLPPRRNPCLVVEFGLCICLGLFGILDGIWERSDVDPVVLPSFVHVLKRTLFISRVIDKFLDLFFPFWGRLILFAQTGVI